VRELRKLLGDVQKAFPTTTGPEDTDKRDGQGDHVGQALLRLAAQDSVKAHDRTADEKDRIRPQIENDVIQIVQTPLRDIRFLLTGMGNLGSVGGLSENGQRKLLEFVLNHGRAEEDVSGEHALRQVMPKTKALVEGMLVKIEAARDDQTNGDARRKGKVPTLILALETEVGLKERGKETALSKRVTELLIKIATRELTKEELDKAKKDGNDNIRSEVGRDRAAAIAALLAGTYHGGFHHANRLRDERIRAAIEKAASLEEGGRFDHDAGVEEAKRIVEHFSDYTLDGSNPIFTKPTKSESNLATHNSNLRSSRPISTPVRARSTHN